MHIIFDHFGDVLTSVDERVQCINTTVYTLTCHQGLYFSLTLDLITLVQPLKSVGGFFFLGMTSLKCCFELSAWMPLCFRRESGKLSEIICMCITAQFLVWWLHAIKLDDLVWDLQATHSNCKDGGKSTKRVAFIQSFVMARKTRCTITDDVW